MALEWSRSGARSAGVAGLLHDPDLGFAAQALACVPGQFDQLIDRHRRSPLAFLRAPLACGLPGHGVGRPVAGAELSTASTAAMIAASGMPWLKTALYWQTLRGARETSSVCSSGSWTAG